MLVGYAASGEETLPLSLAMEEELTFKTMFRVNLKGIASNIFSLDDIQNAMDQSVRNKADIIKSVIQIRSDVK